MLLVNGLGRLHPGSFEREGLPSPNRGTATDSSAGSHLSKCPLPFASTVFGHLQLEVINCPPVVFYAILELLALFEEVHRIFAVFVTHVTKLSDQLFLGLSGFDFVVVAHFHHLLRTVGSGDQGSLELAVELGKGHLLVRYRSIQILVSILNLFEILV